MQDNPRDQGQEADYKKRARLGEQEEQATEVLRAKIADQARVKASENTLEKLRSDRERAFYWNRFVDVALSVEDFVEKNARYGLPDELKAVSSGDQVRIERKSVLDARVFSYIFELIKKGLVGQLSVKIAKSEFSSSDPTIVAQLDSLTLAEIVDFIRRTTNIDFTRDYEDYVGTGNIELLSGKVKDELLKKFDILAYLRYKRSAGGTSEPKMVERVVGLLRRAIKR